MLFTCDPNKSRANHFKHGIVLEFAQYLDWTKEVVWQDVRYNYNEVRMSGLVPLEGKIYAVVYVLRAESTRMISLRKANNREMKLYEKKHSKPST
jgi:uncharacterized DUF497 family protein